MDDAKNIESEKWMKKAQSDLNHAEAPFNLKHYDWVLLACQQSCEKALKAVLINHGEGLIKTHELVILAKKLGASKKILSQTGILTSFYLASRYPDSDNLLNEEENKSAANDSLIATTEILQWCHNLIKI